ncbi:MAG: ABC transporter permease [Nitrospinota bacterium]
MENIWELAFFTAFLAATVRLAVPLVLAALGETLGERAGVLNIGLEGMMLTGAFFGVLGSFYTGSPWLGVLLGVLGGAAIAAIHAVVTITIGADQVVSGAALNLVCLGLTSFLNRLVFSVGGNVMTVPGFQKVEIPVLRDLPLLGEVFFQHVSLVYLSVVLAACLWVLIFKTTWGLRIRAVGEHPLAADTMGVDVLRVRYVCVIVGGAFSGLAGAYLGIGEGNFFVEDMIAGRGFIALAAVVFGRWNPWGVVAGCLLFGGADAVQLNLKAAGLALPYQLMQSVPYVVTLLALMGIAGRTIPPAALMIPYRKGGH